MSDIVYVSPQLYLLSKKSWKTDSQKAGYIPILRADVPKFQQSLQKLNGSANLQQKIIDNGTPAEAKEPTVILSSSSTAEENEAAGLKGRYQSLKQFFPIGLQQQLHTISLRGLPNKLSNEGLERFLTECIKRILTWQCIEETVNIESWTNVRFFELQTQDVYFRFGQIDDKVYAMLSKSLEILFAPSADESGRYAVEFHIDSNTRLFVQDSNVEAKQEGQEEIRNELLKLLKTLEGSDDSSGKTDESVFDHFSDYQVDLNTLSDLPSESLPQLCKDIIDFRTRVVSIEREKRVRESYEENRRRKHQIMRIFDQIRKSAKDKSGPDEIESDESDDEQTEDGGTNEDDLLIERQRQDRIKEESHLRYEEAVRKLQNDIEPRLISLQREISRQQNYEQTLIAERPLHLKELLHRASDPYYDHHRSFKQAEEEKDAADRDKYGSEEPTEALPPSAEATSKAEKHEKQPEEALEAASEQVKIKFAFKKAIEKSVLEANDEEATRDLRENQESQTLAAQQPLPDVLPFQDEQLDSYIEKLKESRLVDELVKEYLGVYEDELVQYILDNIREHKSKQVLLDELKETFDEEAVTIVDAIWSSNSWV
ncbi:hypothetical protein HG536_0C03920 [Torulaspora globosa]|uniref:U1 small nuclear ribonucleoprotein component SNU71 n=1 Tax=Torulaspora globosa TaxID=48254 RepID=A0A7G3ZFD7_9SACH|nr:uncharacterized protein HG536_0C03920 [Torulaspora globosa]QLL32223.1 hypothetical protein HG536_0C03920 [Torulaspora globosa]